MWKGGDSMSGEKTRTKAKMGLSTWITLSFFIALEIVLSRFLGFQQWNIKFSFAFIPVVMAAIMYGPAAAAIVGGVSDFLGAILFPIGSYFPGFTLTAALTGMVLGLFLHKKQSMSRIIYATLINQTFGSLLLNTFWISILYGSKFLPLLITRLWQSAVMSVVTIVVTGIISLQLVPRVRKSNYKIVI